MTKLHHPRQGSVYTTSQILTELELRDMPSLGFWHQNIHTCIQTSHCTDQELLACGIADVLWKYQYETCEWIPVFEAVSSADVLECVDICADLNPWDDEDRPSWWVTPKGLPRQMYGEDDGFYAVRLANAQKTWKPEHFELQRQADERERKYQEEYKEREAARKAALPQANE